MLALLVGGPNRGEDAEIEVEIVKVQSQDLPDVDDEFAQLVSEFDTKLSVYRDCRDIGAESKQISDDTVGLGSIVGLDAKTAGQTFLIKLERKGGVGSLAVFARKSEVEQTDPKDFRYWIPSIWRQSIAEAHLALDETVAAGGVTEAHRIDVDGVQRGQRVNQR